MVIDNNKKLWSKPEVTEIAVRMTAKQDDNNCGHGNGNANGKTGTLCDGLGTEGGHS